MASIDEHAKLNAFRSPKVCQNSQRSPNRASGEQHVVHKHNPTPFQVNWNVASVDLWQRLSSQVISVQCDVDRANGGLGVPGGCNCMPQAPSDWNAICVNSNEHRRSTVPGHNLACQTLKFVLDQFALV